MWRKPPRKVEEALRGMVGIAAVIGGFMTMNLVLFGLPMRERFLGYPTMLLAQIGGIALVVWNPMRRMEIRYARKTMQALPEGEKFLVSLTLRKGKDSYGTDFGVLEFTGGCLYFHGLATSFSLPRSQVRLRIDPVTQQTQTRVIKLLTQVEGEAIWIDFSEDGKKAEGPTLTERFDEFWRVPSEGEFVPPPTQPQPSKWSGRFFPGWQMVAFLSVVYLYVIIEATALQSQGLRSAQRILAMAFMGSLTVALASELVRLVRVLRSPLHDAPVPLLPGTVATSVPMHEQNETHIRA